MAYRVNITGSCIMESEKQGSGSVAVIRNLEYGAEVFRLEAEITQLKKHLDDIKDRDNGMLKYEAERTQVAEECVARAYRALRAQRDAGEPYSTHKLAEETIKYLESKYPFTLFLGT